MQCFGLYEVVNLFFHPMLWFIRSPESVFPSNEFVYTQS